MVVAEVPLWVVHSNSSAESSREGIAVDPLEHKAAKTLALLDSTGKNRKCAIYSIDVHPSGSRFVTAGGDGTVRLWNANALFPQKHKGGHFEESGAYVSTSSGSSSSESEDGKETEGSDTPTDIVEVKGAVHDLSGVVRRKKDGSPAKHNVPSQNKPAPMLSPARLGRKSSAKHHKLLCTMSAHTGSSVLCVRFSNSGKYLASAGDDGVVCIYMQNDESFGNLQQQDHAEHWARVRLCRGHGLDVVDLAWAPDDVHLVSCSLDSETPIIVWRLHDLDRRTSTMICNPFQILGKGIHTSTVKGVTFDPAGSYFASSGDDPAVCIWRAHDDWGLEKRIDAASGIFRKWKEDDVASLSSQSLFRRISWSTDGAFLCSTNCVVRNKHVVSTITRENWSVGSGQTSAANAATLVGHKQPVIVSRHSPHLLNARKSQDDDDEDPEYATLLALGDKSGFITVWSTKTPKPIFRLQSSESRCTVTDLAWGNFVNGDLMLLISLLDGQVVALRFAVPDELGQLLTPKQRAKVFSLRYGIDADDFEGFGRSRATLSGNRGPKLIENVLQIALEHDASTAKSSTKDPTESERMPSQPVTARHSSEKQKETRVGGKKRIQPVLVSAAQIEKRPKNASLDKVERATAEITKEPITDVLEADARIVEKRNTQEPVTLEGRKRLSTGQSSSTTQENGHISTPAPMSAPPQVAFLVERKHSVDLPTLKTDGVQHEEVTVTAECVNAEKIPSGSRGGSVPVVDLSIHKDGQVTWRDQIPGASCSAISAAEDFLALGFVDGSVQLYSCPATIGWTCGVGFRAFPPLIFPGAVVALQVIPKTATKKSTSILVLSSDGSFGVYEISPSNRLLFKGSILPAMNNMVSSAFSAEPARQPQVSRIQFTESGHIMLLLSLKSGSGKPSMNKSESSADCRGTCGPGGSLQAFVYDRHLELWLRVADSRFVLSDFYSTVPGSEPKDGVLTSLEDSVRLGFVDSSIKSSNRARIFEYEAADIFSEAARSSANFTATRTHCEDRMACAMMLKSPGEFSFWLTMYARILSAGGRENSLRVLVDMLLGPECIQGEKHPSKGSVGQLPDVFEACGVQVNKKWWLTNVHDVLGMDRKDLIRRYVVPEMSRNRELQRLTNEIVLVVNQKG